MKLHSLKNLWAVIVLALILLNSQLKAQTPDRAFIACEALKKQINENASISNINDKNFVVDLFKHTSTCKELALKSGSKNQQKNENTLLNNALIDLYNTSGRQLKTYVLYTTPEEPATDPELARLIFNCLTNDIGTSQIDLLLTVDMALEPEASFETINPLAIFATDKYSDYEDYFNYLALHVGTFTTSNYKQQLYDNHLIKIKDIFTSEDFILPVKPEPKETNALKLIVNCLCPSDALSFKSLVFYDLNRQTLNLTDCQPRAYVANIQDNPVQYHGAINSFTKQNQRYVAYYKRKNGEFIGYAPANIGGFKNADEFEKYKFGPTYTSLPTQSIEKLATGQLQVTPHNGQPYTFYPGYCNCDDTKKITIDEKIRLHNFSQLAIKNGTDLENLFKGYKVIWDETSGQNRHTMSFRLFVTDENTDQDIITQIESFTPSNNETIVWIEYNTVTGNFKFNNYHLPKVYNDFKELFADYYQIDDGEFLANVFKLGFDQMCFGIYEYFDNISQNIGYFIIPEYVWNCNSDGYQSIYATIYEYLIAPVDPTSFLLKQIVVNCVPDNSAFSKIFESDFAFRVGCWNGLVTMFKSIPDLLKFIPSLNQPDKRQVVIDTYYALKNYKRYATDEPTDTIPVSEGIFDALVDGLAIQFDPQKSCVFAHSFANIAIGVAVSFINPEAFVGTATGVTGKTLMYIIRAVKFVDKLNDLVPGFVFRCVGKAISPVVKVLHNATKEILYIIKDGILFARLYADDLLQQFDAALVKSVKLETGQYQLTLNTGEKIRIKPFAEVAADALGISQQLAKRLNDNGIPYYLQKELYEQIDALGGSRGTLTSRLDNILNDNLTTFASDLNKSQDLLNFLHNTNMAPQKVFDAWKVVEVNPDIRKTVGCLEMLIDITDPLISPKLAEAGFTKQMLTELFQIMHSIKTTYNIITVEDLITIIKKAEDFPGPGSLKSFCTGLTNKKVEYLYGELFRAKEAYKLIDDIEGVEQSLPKIGPYNGGREHDIVTKSGVPHKYIETKYYKTLLNESIISSYVKQLHKDFLDIFKRIDDNILDPEDAFALYVHRFRKSSGIVDENTLKQELIEIFSDEKWRKIKIEGIEKTVGNISDEIDTKLLQLFMLQKSNYNGLEEFVNDANFFQVITN